MEDDLEKLAEQRKRRVKAEIRYLLMSVPEPQRQVLVSELAKEFGPPRGLGGLVIRGKMDVV